MPSQLSQLSHGYLQPGRLRANADIADTVALDTVMATPRSCFSPVRSSDHRHGQCYFNNKFCRIAINWVYLIWKFNSTSMTPRVYATGESNLQISFVLCDINGIRFQIYVTVQYIRIRNSTNFPKKTGNPRSGGLKGTNREIESNTDRVLILSVTVTTSSKAPRRDSEHWYNTFHDSSQLWAILRISVTFIHLSMQFCPPMGCVCLWDSSSTI